MVAAAEIDPFELVEEGTQHWLHRVPGALERREILFAQAVHMDAVDALHMLGEQLADRKAKAAARVGGVVFCDLALALHRIDAQPDVELLAPRANPIEDPTKPPAFSRSLSVPIFVHPPAPVPCRLLFYP